MSSPKDPNTDHFTLSEAYELFDSLDIVDVDFMIGEWRGGGFDTGHRMDGLLEAYHWQGKRFENTEDVHPLVFRTLGGNLVSVNPSRMGPALSLPFPLPRSKIIGRIFQGLLPLLKTTKSTARLRMTQYRGKCSATMIYDHLPIHDVFRKIDGSTVLGAMDFKGMKTPFFFVLRREVATVAP